MIFGGRPGVHPSRTGYSVLQSNAFKGVRVWLHELSWDTLSQMVHVGVEVQTKEASKGLVVGMHIVWKEGGNGHCEQNGSEAGVHLSIHCGSCEQRTEGWVSRFEA